MTLKGIMDVFVLMFIHVKTRQVIVSPATQKPNEAWVVDQLDQFMKTAHRRGLRVKTIMRDRDTIYTQMYRDRLKELKLRDRTVQFRTPYQNAYAERMILTLQKECLDHYLLFGEKHLDYLLREYLAYYHQHRPHQALGNETIQRLRKRQKQRMDDEPLSLGDIRCEQRLGGLLKSYAKKVALNIKARNFRQLDYGMLNATCSIIINVKFGMRTNITFQFNFTVVDQIKYRFECLFNIPEF